jgi:hypothetical protein
MHGKRRTGTAVVTEGTAQAVLRQGPARELAPEEEKAVRMRLGASLPLSARLERIATATDADIEVLAYEIEAYLVLKAQRGRPAHPSPRPGVQPAPLPSSRTKEKIVRALRRKQ